MKYFLTYSFCKRNWLLKDKCPIFIILLLSQHQRTPAPHSLFFTTKNKFTHGRVQAAVEFYTYSYNVAAFIKIFLSSLSFYICNPYLLIQSTQTLHIQKSLFSVPKFLLNCHRFENSDVLKFFNCTGCDIFVKII